jgi:hypothetical protein
VGSFFFSSWSTVGPFLVLRPQRQPITTKVGSSYPFSVFGHLSTPFQKRKNKKKIVDHFFWLIGPSQPFFSFKPKSMSIDLDHRLSPAVVAGLLPVSLLSPSAAFQSSPTVSLFLFSNSSFQNLPP